MVEHKISILVAGVRFPLRIYDTVAEWSKVVVLKTILFGDAGSNPVGVEHTYYQYVSLFGDG